MFDIRHSFSSAQRGFTLIEGMVSITVLATLIGVAAPSFLDFTANQSIRSASFDLTSDLVLARSEAVKRNSPVMLARINGDWKNGWAVVHVASGTLLGRSKPMSGQVTAEPASSGPLPDSIIFNRNGRVTNGAALEMELERPVGSRTLNRCISLDPSGLPRVAQGAC